MARYRNKDQSDLEWNRTRRQITRDIDTRLQNFREEVLNTALTAAWNKHEEALQDGTAVVLDDPTLEWLDGLLGRLRPALEAVVDGDLANG
jgi:uncharacterized protein (DUF736 family)